MKRIFLATLLIFMMSATTALAANWQQIYTDNDDNTVFFDTGSVNAAWQGTNTQGSRDVVFSAVFRMNYSNKGRDALIDWYRNYSIVPAGIENLSYDVSKIQFKREGEKRYYHISDRTSYTANGSQISSMHYTNSTPNWQEIPVGSVIDVEYYEAVLIVDGKKYDANY